MRYAGEVPAGLAIRSKLKEVTAFDGCCGEREGEGRG